MIRRLRRLAQIISDEGRKGKKIRRSEGEKGRRCEGKKVRRGEELRLNTLRLSSAKDLTPVRQYTTYGHSGAIFSVC
jgi:hypothetical protein